jgi:hypothetical protein
MSCSISCYCSLSRNNEEFLRPKYIILWLLVEVKECGRCGLFTMDTRDILAPGRFGILVDERMYCRWGSVVSVRCGWRNLFVQQDDPNTNDCVKMNESRGVRSIARLSVSAWKL